MESSFTVLFVCVGNVCRSPLAEVLLRDRLDDLLGELSGSVEIRSAGMRAMVGHPMNERAAEELTRLGGSSEDFRARQATEPMLSRAGLVLTATKELRSRVLEEAPGALRRTFTITEFAALVDGVQAESPRDLVAGAARGRAGAGVVDYDVADPMGQSQAVHRDVADRIAGAVEPIAGAVAAAVRSAHEVTNA